jgi:concentrative nucleoside transporter, CNT family
MNTSEPDSIEPKEVRPVNEEAIQHLHATDAPAEGGERRRTHHDIPAHGHNLSLQRSVDENPDLTLHYSHEHQHKHLHHGRPSLVDKHDEVLYAEGTTTDNHLAFVNNNPQDYVKHTLRKPSEQVNEKDFSNSSDAEKGVMDPTRVMTNGSEDDGKKHRVSRTYAKYKIFVHIFIWLFFTG